MSPSLDQICTIPPAKKPLSTISSNMSLVHSRVSKKHSCHLRTSIKSCPQNLKASTKGKIRGTATHWRGARAGDALTWLHASSPVLLRFISVILVLDIASAFSAVQAPLAQQRKPWHVRHILALVSEQLKLSLIPSIRISTRKQRGRTIH